MQARTLILVMLAVICGASAVIGVNQLTTQTNDTPTDNTVPVVTVAKDMPRGSVVSADVLTISQWPAEHAPSGALRTIEEAENRAIFVPLVKGEPLLESKLASKDAGRGMASLIPIGMRAFTIITSHVSAGVGGFIMPDDHVDILLTTTSSGALDRTGGGATTTLMQNIRILAVAQRLDAPDTNTVDPKEMKNVTLLVTPDQAAKLDLGMNKGILHLSLRNPEDDKEADTLPATMAQLRFHQEALDDTFRLVTATSSADAAQDQGAESERKPARRRSTQIRTLRGGHRNNIVVQQAH
jgi:pilus assembly protein CpaB